MSKAKNIKKAIKEGLFRDGKRVGTKLKTIKCIYPPCQNTIEVPDTPATRIITPTPQQSQHPPFCPVHLELVQFCLWLLPQVQIQRGVTPGGLVKPGTEQFKQTLNPPGGQ